MALPNINTPWPPPQFAPAIEQVRRDSAWLSGNLTGIRAQVAEQNPQPYRSRAQFNGGLVGGVARGVLGKPHHNPSGNVKIERHLPVAAQLVAKSANLLGKKPPAFTLHTDDETNEQAAAALDALTSTDRFASAWWDAMYGTAGHGWVFGRIVWNQQIKPSPWIEWVEADQGFAEFANEEQTAVTFWDTYPSPTGKDTYRLLQRHAPWAIEYGLYLGTDTELGMRVPVTEHPSTSYLAEVLDADSEIKTGTPLLTARMIRNLEKNPAWRHDPQLRYYGRSDVSKGGTLWADIDQAWSEIWHEMESGRHRLLIDESLMQSGAPGEGSYFEWLRDVFPVAQGGSADAVATIESIQPELRMDKQMAVVDAASRQAVAAVGLSLMTVGLDPQASGQMTATETRKREATTIDTFDGKSRQVRAEGGELLTAFLHLDAHLNNYDPPTRTVNVSIVEPVQDTELDEATTLQALRSSNLASIHYGVTRLHPEWTPDQVGVEVERIMAELNAGMPADPFAVGEDTPFGTGRQVGTPDEAEGGE